MSLEILFQTLAQRAIELSVEGEDLRCRAPKGALTEDLKREIALHKPAILHRLRAAGLEASRAPLSAFRERALARPDAVAVSFGDEHVSFEHLRVRTERLAEELRRRGAGAEVIVDLRVSSPVSAIAGAIAILEAGAACRPLERPSSLEPRREGIRMEGEDVAGEDVAGSPETAAGHLAFVLSTAGATGAPREVALERGALHRALRVLAAQAGLGPGDAVLAREDIGTGAGLLERLLPLASGARLVLAEEAHPSRDEVRRHGVSVLLSAPTALRALFGADEERPGVRRALSTGEPLDVSLSKRLEDFGCEVVDLYGCVESGLVSAAAGRPLAGASVFVLDDEQDPMAVGAPGELYVGGEGLARGYWGRSAETAERFVPDALSGALGARLFRTGDRARWSSSGRLELLGRASEPPGWLRVESLLREYPGVHDAAVAPEKERSSRGRLVAYVVGEDVASLAVSLARHVKGKLPAQLEPFRFVAIDRLPLGRAGKLDRRALGAEPLPLARVAPTRLPGEELDELLSRTNLTKNQLLVWAGQRLQPDVPMYNIGGMLEIEGNFRPEHAKRALQALIDASDALRTVIEEVDGVPRQKVLPSLTYDLPLHDFSSEPDPPQALEAWAKEQCLAPFDLGECLFRSAILKVSEREHAWFMVQHHLISDAWSFGLTTRHCAELYRRSLEETLDAPPELPRFADFVAFESERRGGLHYRRAREYWRHKLASDPDPIAFYGPDAMKRGTRVDRVTFELDPERSSSVRGLAGRASFAASSENLSRFIIFATVLFTYLHRVSGNRALSVGTTILNRPSKKFKETLGLFMQVAPLRVQISDEETFGTLARKLVAEMQEILRHQRYTLGNSAQRHVYDVLLNYETVQFPRFNDLPSQLRPIYRDHALDSLGLLVRDYTQSGTFSLDFDFHCELFSEAQREKAHRHFLRVLDSLLLDPDRRVSDVSLLSAEECSRIVEEVGRGERRAPRSSSVVALIEERVREQPDAIAVSGEDEALSYGELDARANQLAHRLIGLGVGPEAGVGLSAERSVDMVVGVLGILKAGAAYVPLDPAYPPHRLELMMRGAPLAALVVQRHLREALPRHSGPVVELGAEACSTESRRSPGVEVFGEELAYVIFTSGSTGAPNPVGVSHRSLAHYADFACERFALRPGDCSLQFASISFDISVEEIFSCLTSGATLVLRTEAMGSSVELFLSQCAAWGVHVVNLPTAYWHELSDEIAARGVRLPESVRLVIAGGDKMLPDRLRAFRERVGPGVQLLNGYGPTEATVVATFADLSDEETTPHVGRPIDRALTYVVDDAGSLVPLEVVGEAVLGGAGLARGYLGRPELTAAKFVPCPFGDEPGARLYRTGDRARYRADGNLEILGRLDHQAKVRGFRVELGEIESALVRHPAVRRATVVTRQARSGGVQLVGYLEWDDRSRWSGSELRAFLRERLADYMVPSIWVCMEALPTLPSGKIDRRALPPPPESSSSVSDRIYVAPRTPTEEALCRLWEDVLEVERVGIHDDFFELGGHSLSAIQLVSRIRDVLGAEVPFDRLFGTPTVAGLAELLDSAQGGGDTVEPLDLRAEAVLDPRITAPARQGERVSAPRSVLLTGATGFLGAFLLRELLSTTEASVHCLVRCATEAEGLERVRRNLDAYGLRDDASTRRVVVVPGDLALPLLGISEERFDALAQDLEAIYHCGAWVTGVYPYQTLKAANVLGTQEVLRLAGRGRWKPVHHVSTASVHPAAGYAEGDVLLEDPPLASPEGVVVGYSQSKWVAEKLVEIARSRGLPVAIYRPGQVTGDSTSGVCHTDDVWCRILKTFIELGSAPEVSEEVPVELTPVDYVARALVHLSFREDSLGKAFHLVNPRMARLHEVVEWARAFGYEIREAPLARWGDEVRTAVASRQTALAPLMPLIETALSGMDASRGGSSPPRLDCRNVLSGLEGSGITCPPPNQTLLSTYLSHFVRSGYLPPVRRERDESDAGAGTRPEVDVVD